MVKIKIFKNWGTGDYDCIDAKKRIKKTRTKMLEWINNNNIEVINIQSKSYTGGIWQEESRGVTFTVYYKE